MKTLFVTLLMILTGLTAAAEHFEMTFGEFNELQVVDGINVDYHCDPAMAGKVVFDCDPTKASLVMFEPSGEKLSVKLTIRDTKETGLPTIHVYSSYLTKVENDGDSTVRVLSTTPGPKLQAKLVGNGRLSVRDVKVTNLEAELITGKGMIAVSGAAKVAQLKIIGAGQIQADELRADVVKATLTGTGTINCYPLEALNTSGMGPGKVIYRGKPKVTRSGLKMVKAVSADLPQ